MKDNRCRVYENGMNGHAPSLDGSNERPSNPPQAIFLGVASACGDN